MNRPDRGTGMFRFCLECKRKTPLLVWPMIDLMALIVFVLVLHGYFTDLGVRPKGTRLPHLRAIRPDDNPDPDRLVIHVQRDGTMWICGTRCSDQQVYAILASEADASRGLSRSDRKDAGFSHRTVLINADERVPFRHIRELIRWCKDPRIRIWRLSFGARPWGWGYLHRDEEDNGSQE